MVILGAGVMGQAVLSAIIKSKPSPYPGKIICCTGSEGSSKKLSQTYGSEIEVSFGSNNVEAVKQADVIVLGCKPFMCESITQQVSEGLNGNQLIISLLAGWTISQLKSVCQSKYIARVMTNTPAKYGCGTAVVSLSEEAEPLNDVVMSIVDPVGMAMPLPEKNMDAATSLVGSGPAFVLLMMQAMAEGGVRMGIPYATARNCAAKVMEGTAKMVLESGEHPDVLKSQVCTPGGTTIGGLLIMEDKGVKGAIARAIEEAATIASNLGKK